MSCFKYFFTSSLFLIGQLSSFEMCAINFSLSLFSLLQSSVRMCVRAWWEMVDINEKSLLRRYNNPITSLDRT
jgi:hypothetical protein